jgi:hypothetical protein
MTAQTLDLNIATANAELIFEAAKRLKAAKTRLGGKGAKEDEARQELKDLQREANFITTAMVDDEDMSAFRDLAVVQREMKAANTKLDRALERAHDDKAALSEALDELNTFLRETAQADTADEQEEDAA